ncbi:hypothetical protein [Streptomyces sp. NPDC088196]|uniref:hypothetical protein n=1 Tax=Streptomyces sp. NPDC088196 TaxID=3154868 RepID=UPI00344FE606
MRNKSDRLGTLVLLEINQPWFRCDFTPGEDWDEVEALFEAQAEAFASDAEPVMREAVKAVRELHLKLHSQDDEEVMEPIMIHIHAGEANFRY